MDRRNWNYVWVGALIAIAIAIPFVAQFVPVPQPTRPAPMTAREIAASVPPETVYGQVILAARVSPPRDRIMLVNLDPYDWTDVTLVLGTTPPGVPYVVKVGVVKAQTCYTIPLAQFENKFGMRFDRDVYAARDLMIDGTTPWGPGIRLIEW